MGEKQKLYLSYKMWFLTIRKMCPITRRYYCFTTQKPTFADRILKVRARRELIILYEGTDKNAFVGKKKIQEKDSEESSQILFRKRVKEEKNN